MPKRLTPDTAAEGLRVIFDSMIPVECYERGGLTAFQFAKMVQEQTGCTFEEAMGPTQRVCPELFADYWQERMGA